MYGEDPSVWHPDMSTYFMLKTMNSTRLPAICHTPNHYSNIYMCFHWKTNQNKVKHKENRKKQQHYHWKLNRRRVKVFFSFPWRKIFLTLYISWNYSDGLRYDLLGWTHCGIVTQYGTEILVTSVLVMACCLMVLSHCQCWLYTNTIIWHSSHG